MARSLMSVLVSAPATRSVCNLQPGRLTRLRSLLAALVVLCGLTGALPALADAKIGVVDLQKVLTTTNAGKAARKKFEDLQKSKQGTLERKEKELAGLEKELVSQRQQIEKEAQASGGNPSEELRAKIAAFQEKARKFEQQMMELEKKRREIMEDLTRKEAELLKPIEQTIKTKVDAIAKERGLDVVLDKRFAIYASDATDVTAEVIRRCDAP